MNSEEIKEIIEKRIAQLNMSIEGDAKWKIINLSKGLPSNAHSLGKLSCFSALASRSTLLLEEDVDQAIEEYIRGSHQSLKSSYETAIRSNQPGNLFKHVLTACALAKSDDSGYFTPVAVRAPLSSILKKSVEIANFQRHLNDFTEERRGVILQRTGEARSYRLRFRQPAMQPYVIMRGITDSIIDESAKRALSSPEQSDLFPTS